MRINRCSRSPLGPTLAALLSAVLPLAFSSSAAAQNVQTPRLSQAYPVALSGEEAVLSLGNDAARIAAQNDLTEDELVELLRRDASAWLGAGRVFYVDTPTPLQQEPPGPTRVVSQALTQQEVFQLHSRPGAPRVILLDFDGHHSVNNSWGHNIVFPAYNTDGNAAAFSAGELLSIEGQFLRVAEDFAPFEVDVTTEEPPAGGLTKNGAGDTTWGGRCVMTQQTNGFGNGIGGVAFLNSFGDPIDNPCFGFNQGTNNGSMTASHEVGHMLGLFHDGLNGSEYHPGVGGSQTTSWGPIMGAPFGKNLVQWSDGSYSGATNTQNDYNTITKANNGTPFRADDFTDLVPSANALSFECPDLARATVAGLIEKRTDADTFGFHTRGGLVTLEADPIQGGPNLDILLELYDDTGLLLASANEVGLVDATISIDLSAGSYTVRIDGTERIGRYTDYGCLGQYTIRVSVPLWQDLAGGSSNGPVLAGSGTACELEPVELAVSGALRDSFVLLFFGAGEFLQPFLGGVLVPDVSRGGDIWALPTDGGGSAAITRIWPAGVPSGTRVVFQAWAVDPQGLAGFSGSNAIVITAP